MRSREKADQEESENTELSDASDAELHEHILNMHQLPDTYWGARAKAELDKREKKFQREQLDKQLKIGKISLWAAFLSASVAAILMLVEIIKLIS